MPSSFEFHALRYGSSITGVGTKQKYSIFREDTAITAAFPPALAIICYFIKNNYFDNNAFNPRPAFSLTRHSYYFVIVFFFKWGWFIKI